MTVSDPNSLPQRNRELTILYHIAETLNHTTDLQTALDDTLRSIVELLGLQTAWAFLMNESGTLYLAAWHDLPPALLPNQEPWKGGCNCNNLFRAGHFRHAVNIVQCSRLAEAQGDRHGLEVHASVPLRSEEHMLGILNVASPGSDRFTPDVLELLGTVGYQLGTAIERARLARQAVDMAALEERNRLAREIHDTVAQGLTAITLYLEAAEASDGNASETVRKNIRNALDLARTNLDEVRRSVLDLRAAPLEGKTLPEALAILLRDFGSETEINAVFQNSAQVGRLPPALEAGLYRIVQEALSNIRKHAHAQEVRVDLEREQTALRLRIMDDGQGFEPAAVQQRPESGFGITGMSERARLLGGELQICSSPGTGTSINATVALPPHIA